MTKAQGLIFTGGGAPRAQKNRSFTAIRRHRAHYTSGHGWKKKTLQAPEEVSRSIWGYGFHNPWHYFCTSSSLARRRRGLFLVISHFSKCFTVFVLMLMFCFLFFLNHSSVMIKMFLPPSDTFSRIFLFFITWASLLFISSLLCLPCVFSFRIKRRKVRGSEKCLLHGTPRKKTRKKELLW